MKQYLATVCYCCGGRISNIRSNGVVIIHRPVSLKQAPVVIATSGETVYVVWRSSNPVTKTREVSWRLIVA